MHNFATSKYWKAQLAKLPHNNLLHTMMELDRVPAWLWEWVGEPDYDGTFSALLEFSNFIYFGNILLHSPPQNFPQIIN